MVVSCMLNLHTVVLDFLLWHILSRCLGVVICVVKIKGPAGGEELGKHYLYFNFFKGVVNHSVQSFFGLICLTTRDRFNET